MIQILCFYLLPQFNPLQGQKLNFTVSKEISDNIFLYYYQGPTFNDRTVLKLEEGLSLILQKDFDVNSNTIFFLHGWGQNATYGSAKTIVSAFLQAKIRNIVALDYSRLLQNSNFLYYISSVINASFIGDAIGEFLLQYTPEKQPLELIKIVSHSLGAQIMAQAARKYGIGKLPRLTESEDRGAILVLGLYESDAARSMLQSIKPQRINRPVELHFGLDPAGPLYTLPFVKHLEAEDGKFVDIIHTDGGWFGDGRTIGHVDFFPNRGTRVQPGCNDSDSVLNTLSELFRPPNREEFCSHDRSWEYYAESIINTQAFIAKQCQRTIFTTYCCCNSSSLSYMGYYVDTSVRGTYFLETNSTSPYGEELEGVNFN